MSRTRSRALAAAVLLATVTGPVCAQSTQLKCDMQTTFHKTWIGDTTWDHVEKKVTKYFLIDRTTKKVSVYNARQGVYVPICSDKNTACASSWTDASILVDGTRGPDDPKPPHLDFRRSFALTQHGTRARLVIADFGDNAAGHANMEWTYEGGCAPNQDRLTRSAPPGAPAATFKDALAMPVSDAERNQAWASRRGNTTTGLSAGGRSWFHMWFFDDGVGYTGDGDDFTNEGMTRQWYVGKTAMGEYRLCEEPVPAAGERGCYPFPAVKVNDTWTEQDVYGPATFTLLPGRQ